MYYCGWMIQMLKQGLAFCFVRKHEISVVARDWCINCANNHLKKLNCSYFSAPLVMFIVSHSDAFECIKKWNCSHFSALHWGLVEAIWMHWEWYILIPWARDSETRQPIESFSASLQLYISDKVSPYSKGFLLPIYIGKSVNPY